MDIAMKPAREIIESTVPGTPTLAYSECGTGPVIIFLHGVGADSTSWDRQISYFGERFRAVAWDARGYGKSHDFQGSLEMSDFSGDLLRLINHLGCTQVHLVGQSMGGLIIQDFYSRHPDRVLSLTLVNTTRSLRSSMTDDEVEAFLNQRKLPLISGKTPADLASSLAQAVLANNPDASVLNAVVAGFARLRSDTYIRALEMVARYRQRINFMSVKVPTLIITSDQDRLTPRSAGASIADEIPKSILVELKGVGHMSHLEAADEFNRILLHFLESVDHKPPI